MKQLDNLTEVLNKMIDYTYVCQDYRNTQYENANGPNITLPYPKCGCYHATWKEVTSFGWERLTVMNTIGDKCPQTKERNSI